MTKKRTVVVNEKEFKKEKEVIVTRKVSIAVKCVYFFCYVLTLQAHVPLKRSGRIRGNVKTDTAKSQPKGKCLKKKKKVAFCKKIPFNLEIFPRQ